MTTNPYCTCDPCTCKPPCTCGLELADRKENAKWDDASQTMTFEVVEVYKPKSAGAAE